MLKKKLIKANIVFVLVLLMILLASIGCAPKTVDQPKTAPEVETGKEPVVIDEPIFIKVAHDSQEGAAIDQGFHKFKELLEEKTGGQVVVEIFPAGQLSGGDSFVSATMLQSGDIDVSTIMPGIFARFDERFQVLCLPFMWGSLEDAYQAWDGYPGQYMLDLLSEKGLKGLGYFSTGIKIFTNDLKPVVTPEDLRGMKIRTPDSPIVIETITALGGIPTVTSMGELFITLQQGVVDGQENAIGTIYTRGLHEVQGYATVTGHEIISFPLSMNKKLFDSLPTDIQESVLLSAKEAADYQRELIVGEEELYLKAMEDEGVHVTNLTPEQKQIWIDTVAPVHKKFESVIGKDILELFNK